MIKAQSDQKHGKKYGLHYSHHGKGKIRFQKKKPSSEVLNLVWLLLGALVPNLVFLLLSAYESLKHLFKAQLLVFCIS
jgi:hypothetical protein